MVGQIVRYARPEPGEEDLTFVVVEDNGDRVLIQSRDFPADYRFTPQEVVAASDVVPVEAANG